MQPKGEIRSNKSERMKGNESKEAFICFQQFGDYLVDKRDAPNSVEARDRPATVKEKVSYPVPNLGPRAHTMAVKTVDG
jgi:hypothetical protein